MTDAALAPMRAEVPASSVFFALLRRDMRVARRELPFFLLRTTLQPLMFVIVFGYLLPRMGFMGRGYTTALLPGVLAISLTFSSIQSVALPMVQDFGWTKEIEDRLLAPVPIILVAAEKIVSGVLQGIVSALFVLPVARLIMGTIPNLTFAHFGSVLLITILVTWTFSRHRHSAAANRINVRRHTGADDFLWLRVLPVAGTEHRTRHEVRGADQPAGLRGRGNARGADSGIAAHDAADRRGCADCDHGAFLAARYAQLPEASGRLDP
jgi:hypothetical protein